MRSVSLRRMYVRCLALAAALALVILVGLLLRADGAGAGAKLSSEVPAGARLLSSTESGVVFEVLLSPDDLRVSPVEYGGETYAAVEVDDWPSTGRSGAPELPLVEVALGVPTGVGLRVQVSPGQSHTILLPADAKPTMREDATWDWAAWHEGRPWLPSPVSVVARDPDVYGSPGPYPGLLGEVVSDGMVRQQRVAGVAVYPIQYRPLDRELIVYETLVVTVEFEGNGQGVGRPREVESESFERLLRHGLLNYESATGWREKTEPVTLAEGVPWAPPVPGYKIQVEKEGFYKVTYEAMAAAGVPVEALDPRTFRLYVEGTEVATYVEGEAGGDFDPGEYLLFYGEALASKYSRCTVYWLTWGQGLGLRMPARDGTPANGSTPPYHGRTLHMEGNKYYIPVLSGDEDLERYVWDYVYAPSRPSWTYTFSLAAPYGGSFTARLRVAMFGYLSSPINPDHHTRLYVNGTLVEDAWWDGIIWRISTIEIPQSLLMAGNNTIQLVCPNDTGVGYDVVEIDWVELDFADTFVAVGNQLAFRYDVPGSWQYRVDGFDSSDVLLFDTTDPKAVRRITGGDVFPYGSGYSVRFEDAVGSPTAYVVMTMGAILAPVGIELDSPSSLASPGNGADYIIITHPDFYGEMMALRDYRALQGLRAMVVDVRDVYDEFGHGQVGARAIRDFLAYTYANWQAPAPTYVLLVGDGTYDPKNYEGFGRVSYMPPYLAPVDPWINETASDNRYVTLTPGDTFPDMIIGRFSVNSPAEAAIVVNKVLSYEQNPEMGDWRTKLLFVADNADQAGDFAALSDAIIGCCTVSPFQVDKVHYLVTHMTKAEARAAIIAAVNSGRLIVNYIGHAGVNGWASESLFSVGDLGQLSNGARLPIMLPMTCYDGYFHYPFPSGAESMGESLVRASAKGSIASWSPAGLGVATGHDRLDRGFLAATFLDHAPNLGEATIAGKLRLWVSGTHRDLIDTYLLFGDPAMEMNLLLAEVGIEKSVTPTTPLQPNDVLTYTLSVVNEGPDLGFRVAITDAIPAFVRDAQVVYSSLTLTERPGRAFAWDVENLAPGQTGTIVIRGVVRGDQGLGWFVNEAEISVSNREVGTRPNLDNVPSLVVAGPPALMQVSASPTQIPVGGSASTISAQIWDQWGNPVADGTVVSFSTNRGTLIPSTVYVTGGWAHTMLTSGQTTGLATVTAQAGSAQGECQVTFSPGPPTQVTLGASPSQIPVGGATSTIEAVVRDQFGNLVADGTLVSFTTTLGSVSPTAVPTEIGEAQTTLTSGTQAGVAVVTAQAGSAVGTLGVSFVAGPAAVVSLTAEPGSIPVGGSGSSLAAWVADPYGNPVADGTPVSFSTDRGGVSPSNGVTSGGWAYSTLTSGQTVGVASVSALAGGVQGTCQVVFLPGPPAQMVIAANPNQIPVGGATSVIQVVVRDQFSNLVADGTLVSFATTKGSVAPTPVPTTNGAAQTTLTSGTEVGVGVVTAQAGGAIGQVGVPFVAGPVAAVSLTAEPGSILVGGNSGTIAAWVTDLFGNAVADGTAVSFSTDRGSISPSNGATSGGWAYATLTSGQVAGLATVTAQAGGVQGTCPVAFLPGSPAQILLTAAPSQISVGGMTSAIQAVVRDQFGNLAADGTLVVFATTLGSLAPTSVLTLNGIAETTLTSGNVVGAATVTAQAGSAIGSVGVMFVPGPAASLTLSATPGSVTVGGVVALEAMVRDAWENPVADGTPVGFASTLGNVSPPSSGTVSGKALSALHAGTIAGQATITASAGSVSGTAFVDVLPGPPAVISLAAFPPSIPLTGTAVLTATVTDIHSNRVVDGTEVQFQTTLGALFPPSALTLDGVAVSSLQGQGVQGVATVTAQAGVAAGVVQVNVGAGAPYSIELTASPSVLVADGLSVSTITALVVDPFGEPITRTVPITFATTLGQVEPAFGWVVGGQATSALSSTQSGVALVSARVGSTSALVTVTFVAGPTAIVSLTAQPASIPVGGNTSVISAWVADQYGNPVADGTVVTFTRSRGGLNPYSAHTSGGWAYTTLTSGQVAGVATVTGTAGGIQGTCQVVFVPGPPTQMVIAANPNQIPAGGAISVVQVVVRDQFSNLVADGTPVSFSTTRGSVAPTPVPTANGAAQTTLTSGAEAGLATVTAQSASALSTVGVPFVPGLPAMVSLTAQPGSIPVGGYTASIAMWVADGFGNPVADGTATTFSANRGSVSPVTGLTSGGWVYTTLTSGEVAGLTVVTGKAGAAQGTCEVTFLPAPPAVVVVTATPSQVPVGGAASAVSAMVRDQYGNPVADGTQVDFSTTRGSVVPSSSATLNGAATTTLLSGTEIGIATVTAQATGAVGSVGVTFVAGPPWSVVLVATPPTVPLNGLAALEATVRDAWQNPVADGTVVSFVSTLGQVSPSSIGTLDGKAAVTLLAGTIAGQAAVTASAGGGIGTVSVTIVAGSAAHVFLGASPDVLVANGQDQSGVVAQVVDSYGNAVADGTLVSFSTTLGTVQPAVALTVDGEACTTLTAGTVAGVAVVAGATAGVSGDVHVMLLPGPAAILELAASPPSIPAGGHSQSVLVATVRDQFGNAVADGSLVEFTTTLGSVSPVTSLTEGGNAQSTLTSGSQAGTALVSAVCGSAAGSTEVLFYPGRASTVVLAAAPYILVADGSSTAVITATVADEWGEPVPDGTTVHFWASMGNITPASGTTLGGVVVVSFRSGLEVGRAQIRAWSGEAAGETWVQLVSGPVSVMLMSAEPAVLVADRMSKSTVRVRLLDAWGHAVADGVRVALESTHGNIDPAVGYSTGGWVTSTLTSGLVLGAGKVTARCGQVSASVNIYLVPGPPAVLTLEVGRQGLAGDGVVVAPVTAVVWDAWGHWVEDNSLVTFTASDGQVVPESGYTRQGTVRAQFQAGCASESVEITAFAPPGASQTVVFEMHCVRVLLPLVGRRW